MELKSLNSFRNEVGDSDNATIASHFDVLQEVLRSPGQIRRIDIATAYTDIDALKTLFDLVAKRGDRRSGASVRIFLDYQNTCKLADELLADQVSKSRGALCKKLNKVLNTTVLKTKKGTNHCVELFAVQLGTLFHSKAFVMKTNTHWATCVGSVNFTTRGFTTNEEIAVTEMIDHAEYKKKVSLTSQVLRYLDTELFSLDSAGKIPFKFLTEKRSIAKYSGVRDLLLGGRLWYEDKEQAPFGFPLNLPKTFLKSSAEVQGISIPNLESTLGNTLNVLKLIRLDEKSAAPKSRWRKAYCIQTCFGLWAPRNWTEDISMSLAKQSCARRIWLDSVIEQFRSRGGEIHQSICTAYDETWDEIRKISSVDMSNRLSKKRLEENVATWINRMNAKLATESFKKKILTGVTSVEMPDLWGANPSDANSFEDSFFEHLEYEMARVAAGARKRSFIATNVQTCLDGKKTEITRDHLVNTFIESGNWILGNYAQEVSSDPNDEGAQEDDD